MFLKAHRISTAALALLTACGAAGDGTGASGPAASTTDAPATTAAATTAAPVTTGTTGAPDTTEGGSTGGGTSFGSSGAAGTTDAPETTGGAVECAGEPFPAWISGGPDCPEPEFQVFAYDADTYILRQSLCTNFEGPFLYLLFGTDKVLLEDTGAGGVAVADAVYGVIDAWLAERGRPSIELVVVNSHAHGDHVAGNPQFEGQPNTSVVGVGVDAVAGFFAIDAWPQGQAELDLGGRVVDVLPIPGHEASHVALYDRARGLLLTGDTLYPGRLYIKDFPAYTASIARLVDFAHAHEVCHVLGTHIEMTQTPGVDFEYAATHHPDEHALELDVAHLEELLAAVLAMGDTPVLEAHDDFIVYPLD